MKQDETKSDLVVHHMIICFLLTFNAPLLTMAQRIPIAVRVGVIVDMKNYVGEMGLNCISMALSDFYVAHPHYRTRLVLIPRDSDGDVLKAAAAGVDLLKNEQVYSIFGPLFSSEASFMIVLGDKAQVPIITFSATSPSLLSSRTPYFIRAALDDSSQVEPVVAIVQAYGWQEVVLIYEDNVFGEGILPSLVSSLEQVGAHVLYRMALPPLVSDDQIVVELNKAMSRSTRVFIVHTKASLGSRLFNKVKELGMLSEDYAWIITSGMANELDSLDPLTLESMKGVIGIRPYTSRTKELVDFKIRYKKTMQQKNPSVLSPEVNIFGLWAYDATVALAFAAEIVIGSNATFLRPPNISTNSTTLDSFVTFPVGPELIRALRNISSKGLAGKFQLTEGQLQPPPFEFINVIGQGCQVLGYWTRTNGITKDLNFTSSGNIKTYSTDKSNFLSTIWPGDKIYPPKGCVTPGNGERLKVGVPVELGFPEFVRVTWNADNSTTVGGMCIDIFDEVMKNLPCVQYDYHVFATTDHRMAGSYDDLVNQVYLKKYDAVVGDVTILASRSQRVDFTLPFMDSGISMVVPFVDDKTKNGWIFLKPLTRELWFTTFFFFVFIGLLIWLLECPVNEDFHGTPWSKAGTILWFSFSTMVFAQKKKLVTTQAKFILTVWYLVVLIITQSYTANLASLLTVQRLDPTFTDINMLIKTNQYVGYKNGSFVYEFLRKMNLDKARLLPFISPEEMDDLLQKGSGMGGIAAAFHEVPYIKIFLAKHCSKYTMAGPIYRADGFGFVFPRGSKLVSDVSRAILNYTDGKTTTEIERNWLSYENNCADDSSWYTKEDSLPLKSFQGLFQVITMAGLLAFICRIYMFLMENWVVLMPPAAGPQPTTWGKIIELYSIYIKAPETEPETLNKILEIIGRLDIRDPDCGGGGEVLKIEPNIKQDNSLLQVQE